MLGTRQADRRAVGLRSRRLSGWRDSRPGWAEWNDTVSRHRARLSGAGKRFAAALTPRLCASADHFNHAGRRAWACVNFITAHDGFTLNDLVTYNDKHNEANGEDNKDGNSDNRVVELRRGGPDRRSGDQ